jgi:hypothetical protein
VAKKIKRERKREREGREREREGQAKKNETERYLKMLFCIKGAVSPC